MYKFSKKSSIPACKICNSCRSKGVTGEVNQDLEGNSKSAGKLIFGSHLGLSPYGKLVPPLLLA